MLHVAFTGPTLIAATKALVRLVGIRALSSISYTFLGIPSTTTATIGAITSTLGNELLVHELLGDGSWEQDRPIDDGQMSTLEFESAHSEG